MAHGYHDRRGGPEYLVCGGCAYRHGGILDVNGDHRPSFVAHLRVYRHDETLGVCYCVILAENGARFCCHDHRGDPLYPVYDVCAYRHGAILVENDDRRPFCVSRLHVFCRCDVCLGGCHDAKFLDVGRGEILVENGVLRLFFEEHCYAYHHACVYHVYGDGVIRVDELG